MKYKTNYYLLLLSILLVLPVVTFYIQRIFIVSGYKEKSLDTKNIFDQNDSSTYKILPNTDDILVFDNEGKPSLYNLASEKKTNLYNQPLMSINEYGGSTKSYYIIGNIKDTSQNKLTYISKNDGLAQEYSLPIGDMISSLEPIYNNDQIAAVIFHSRPSMPGEYFLYLLNIKDLSKQKITLPDSSMRMTDVFGSPTINYIVIKGDHNYHYDSANADSYNNFVYLLNADTNKMDLLDNGYHISSVKWSSAGKKFFYNYVTIDDTKPKENGIIVYDIATGEKIKFSNSDPNLNWNPGSPYWFPGDENYIYVYENTSTSNKIHIYNLTDQSEKSISINDLEPKTNNGEWAGTAPKVAPTKPLLLTYEYILDINAGKKYTYKYRQDIGSCDWSGNSNYLICSTEQVAAGGKNNAGTIFLPLTSFIK